MKKIITECLKIVIPALLIAFILSHFVIVNARVPSASMVGTIDIGDRLIANRLAYTFNEPQRGDIIIFISHEDHDKSYVKRLIGVPGDHIEIHEGIVTINGEDLDEPYLNTEEDTRDFGPYDVPEDGYFFLGDNRERSLDARFWEDTFIKRKDLVGKVVLRYYPAFEWYN